MRAGHGDWLTTLLLGVLSLIPRLYVALAWSREPIWDGHYYDFGARRIAEGFGYSADVVVNGSVIWQPWCHYPVGYSGFLAGFYFIFGSGQYVAPILNALVGAGVVILTHRIGMYWLSPPRAILAAVLCGINLELIFYTPVVMTEIVATAGPLLAIWLVLIHREHHPWRGAVLSGAALGLATLVQPQAILLAPFLGYVVVRGRSVSLRRMAGVVLLTVASLSVVVPWTYRNCRVMDGCAFVSTNGGWNLAIGSFPRATGRFETLRASDGCAVVTGQVQQDRCWGALGMEMIRKDPWRWMGLAPLKLGHCFDHASFPVEYLGQADPTVWSEPVRQRWREVLTTFHHLLLSVAAFGFLAGRVKSRRGLWIEVALRSGVAGLVAYAWSADAPTFWPLALAIIVTGSIPRSSSPKQGAVHMLVIASFLLFVLTHAVFFGEDRYHVRLIPMMCLLAAAMFRPSR